MFNLSSDTSLSDISIADSSLTTLLKIEEEKHKVDPKTEHSSLSNFNSSGLVSAEELERLYSGVGKPDLGKIRVVDITHERYAASYADTVKTSADVNYY